MWPEGLASWRMVGAPSGALEAGAVLAMARQRPAAGAWLDPDSARRLRGLRHVAAAAELAGEGVSRPRHCRLPARIDDWAAGRGNLRVRRPHSSMACEGNSLRPSAPAGADLVDALCLRDRS